MKHKFPKYKLKKSKDILDFEDLFAIYTPSGIERSITSLNSAWESLYKLDPTDSLLSSEYNAWLKWSTNALRSTLSKWFASGTMVELDQWKERYKNIFTRIKAKGSIDIAATNPEVFNPPSSGISIPLWAVITVLGISLAGFLYYKGNKTLLHKLPRIM